jgi:hypothetical protein
MSDAEGNSLANTASNTTNSSSDDAAASSSQYSSSTTTATAKQQRLKATTGELRRINSSLSALGNCIAALGEVTQKKKQ